MVWKMMKVEEFQDGCLMLGNRWYADGMILAILSIRVARTLPSNLCSRGYMVWKKMLVE